MSAPNEESNDADQQPAEQYPMCACSHPGRLILLFLLMAILALLVIFYPRSPKPYYAYSEGIAGCGTIRYAFRVYAEKHGGTYPVLQACDASQLEVLGIGAKDLERMYYKVTDYSVTSDTDSYIITATHPITGETYIINHKGEELGTLNTGG